MHLGKGSANPETLLYRKAKGENGTRQSLKPDQRAKGQKQTLESTLSHMYTWTGFDLSGQVSTWGG